MNSLNRKGLQKMFKCAVSRATGPQRKGEDDFFFVDLQVKVTGRFCPGYESAFQPQGRSPGLGSFGRKCWLNKCLSNCWLEELFCHWGQQRPDNPIQERVEGIGSPGVRLELASRQLWDPEERCAPSTWPVRCRVHFLPYSRAFTLASRVGGKGPTAAPRWRQALPRVPYGSGPRGPAPPPKSKVQADLSDFVAASLW